MKPPDRIRQCPYLLWHAHGSHQCWRHADHDGEHRTACRTRGGLLEPAAELTWLAVPA